MDVTRNVALTDDTYAALARRKRPGWSFSDAVDELLHLDRPRLADVVGIAADEAHWDAFQKERRKARSVSSRRARLD